MRKIQLDEREVIAMYEHVENAREVAARFNVSDETIYRILKRNGIKRTHRHLKIGSKIFKSHCRSKYCPALIVLLHKVYDWNARQIAEVTGYAENGTRNVLSKRGLIPKKQRVNKSDFDLEQIEREYLSGISTYKLSEKYGIARSTISDWMIQRGIKLGKGAHQEGRKGRTRADDEFVYSERMREINHAKHEEGERRFIERLKEYHGDKFEYVGGFRDGGRLVATIRCTACGHEFVHGITDMGKNWQCPKCAETERKTRIAEREGAKYEHMFSEIREYATPKVCAHCGGKFQSVSPIAKYCSKKCRERARSKLKVNTSDNFRHYYHVRYGNDYLLYYDRSVTLKSLYERDGGVCQICGEPCDWDDREWGNNGPTYPSLDHIIPRAHGGTHTWDNVQLAHCMCNSCKRDQSDDVVKNQVVQRVS